jgi:hypothetical protein
MTTEISYPKSNGILFQTLHYNKIYNGSLYRKHDLLWKTEIASASCWQLELHTAKKNDHKGFIIDRLAMWYITNKTEQTDLTNM